MSGLIEKALGAIVGGVGEVAGGTASAPLQAASGVASLIKGVMDRVSPDPAQAAAAKLAVDQLAQAGHFKDIDAALAVDTAQAEINKIEAGSASFWNSGWRPGVGWVCVVSLALMYWPKAMILSGLWMAQAIEIIRHSNDLVHAGIPPFPDLGVSDLVGLLGSILGLGTLRTIDKRNGVAS